MKSNRPNLFKKNLPLIELKLSIFEKKLLRFYQAYEKLYTSCEIKPEKALVEELHRDFVNIYKILGEHSKDCQYAAGAYRDFDNFLKSKEYKSFANFLIQPEVPGQNNGELVPLGIVRKARIPLKIIKDHYSGILIFPELPSLKRT